MIPDLLIALVKSPTTEYSVQKEEEGGSTSTQDDFAIGGPLEIHHYSWIISGFFTFLSVLVSVWIIVEHIRYYKEPARQRFMVRIIVMVPIYALGSYFSLLWRHYAFYFALVRDCYESYVLYMFFRLLIELGDSEEVMIQKMEQVRQIKCYWPLCFWHIKPGRIFLHRCKQFILQFVLLKPILAIVTFLLELSDSYREGNFAPQYGYLYICLIYNISITFALWFLVLFYEATKDILKQYKPISKFLCIKSIIFFSYWQSVVIAIMLHFNILIRGKGDWSITDVAVGLQNFLICVEMFPLAVSHAVSFGPQAYKDETIGEFLVEPNLVERIVDVANVADVFYDTYVALKLGPKRNVVVAGSYGNFFDQSREKMAELAVKHGWIEKRGEDIAKIWKRRYCMILSDPVGLVYFKFNPLETPDGQFIKARGWVNFEGMTEVRPHPKSNVRWTVVTPARNWHFRCADSQQRGEWIEACKGLKIEEIYN